jgi:hypothetical protein
MYYIFSDTFIFQSINALLLYNSYPPFFQKPLQENDTLGQYDHKFKLEALFFSTVVINGTGVYVIFTNPFPGKSNLHRQSL